MDEVKCGDKVTCKVATEAYYSNYGGMPRMTFQPGMVGVVKAIAPKVRLTAGPGQDRKLYFLVVDYDCPVTSKTQRVGLCFCNAVKV